MLAWLADDRQPQLTWGAVTVLKAGNPVRRGLSLQSRLSLDYWITRFRG